MGWLLITVLDLDNLLGMHRSPTRADSDVMPFTGSRAGNKRKDGGILRTSNENIA